jgi:hypothetical protein
MIEESIGKVKGKDRETPPKKSESRVVEVEVDSLFFHGHLLFFPFLLDQPALLEFLFLIAGPKERKGSHGATSLL